MMSTLGVHCQVAIQRCIARHRGVTPVLCYQLARAARRGTKLTLQDSKSPGRACMRACRAKRVAPGTFHGHLHWFCLHLPRASVRRVPEYVFELTSTPAFLSGVELE